MLLGKLLVSLGVDMKKFNAGLASAEQRMKKTGETMQKMGKTMSLFITLPLLAAGAAAFKTGSDMEEAINKVDVAFGDSSNIIKEWGKTTLETFGLAQVTALDMVSLFGDMATSMGFAQGNAANMSKSLVGLAADMASFKNIGVDQVSSALKGIFTGETESLKTLGIIMTQANLKAFALSEGIDKTVESMSQAEKVQLRYNFVLSVTKNSQGDFLRTQAGAANQMRIFTESIKEVATTFGQLLLPIFTPMIKRVNEWMSALKNMDESTKKWILGIAGVAAAIGPLLYVGGKLLSMLGPLVTVVKSLGTAFTFLLANPVLLAVAAVVALGAAVVLFTSNTSDAIKHQEKFNETINKTLARSEFLFGALNKVNASMGDRKRAIDEINSRYSEYLPNLLTEKSTLKDIEKAQKLVNDGLINSIAIRLKEQAVVDITTAQLDVRSRLVKAGFDLEKLGSSGFSQEVDDFGRVTTSFRTFGQEIDNLISEYNQLEGKKKDVSKLFDGMVADIRKTIMTTEDVVDDNADLEDGLKDITDLKEKAVKSEITLRNAVKSLNEEYGLQRTLSKSNIDTKRAELQYTESLFELYRTFYAEGGYTGDERQHLKELKGDIDAVSLALSKMTGKRGTGNVFGGFGASVMKASNNLDKFKQTAGTVATAWENASARIGDAIKSSMESFIVGAAEMIANASNSADMGTLVLSTLAELAIAVGKIAISVGVGVAAIKKALETLNPIVAIAAGVALVGLGTWAKTSLAAQSEEIQGLATGGNVTRGGAFMVGERGPELVHLNAGSAVIPNHALGDGSGEIRLIGKLQGSDMLIMIERATAKKKRR